MFLGRYEHSIDDKGRLTIPAKFRGDLAAGVVVTKGIDCCLYLFPTSQFETLAARIRELPITQEQAREFRRQMFADASDEIPDKQGRIIIPPYLREYAGIDAQVIVTGLDTYIEIWSTEVWHNRQTPDNQHWEQLGI
ncbi:MAG: division/cell wall cluster transcriptional repressor MraZ [Chloroflexota bacterium]